MHTAELKFWNFVKLKLNSKILQPVYQGPRYIGSNHEKNGGLKSRDTLPLSNFLGKFEPLCETDFKGLFIN